ncbi:hypothetical protein D3C71_174740 [compost metagenome]
MELIPNNLGQQFVHLVAWLEGRRYTLALKALRYARRIHNGYRKDDVTPEFAHQLFQALYIKGFDDKLIYPEETFATIFLHDTPEDSSKTFKEIYDLFGQIIGEAVELMTKKKDGVVIPMDLYVQRMAANAITTVAKPTDNLHNQISMPNAPWTISKMRSYRDDGERLYIPLLKAGRQNFPEQADIYYNLQTALEMQFEWSARHLDLMEAHAALQARIDDQN